MAGATNRALKAAGVPKSTIKTLRVESGGRLNLRSAIQIASARGLDIGKAHEHLARRDAKAEAKRASGAQDQQQKRVATLQRSTVAAGKAALAARKDAAIRAIRDKRAANRPEAAPAPGTAQQRLRREADRAPYSGVVHHPFSKDKRLVFGKNAAEMRARVETAKKAMQADYERSPRGQQGRHVAGLLQAGTTAVRAAGEAPKGSVHVYNPDNKSTATHKALATKGGAVVYRDTSRTDNQFGIVHKGSGLTTGFYKSKADATNVATGMQKSFDRSIARMAAGDGRAATAMQSYNMRKRAELADRPSPQAARAAAKREEKQAKDDAVKASTRAFYEKQNTRKLKVAQRLTRMIQKAKDDAGDARVAAYRAQVAVKKNGLEPMRQAESKAATLGARVKHLEARAKKLRIDPSRTYRDTIDVIRPL